MERLSKYSMSMNIILFHVLLSWVANWLHTFTKGRLKYKMKDWKNYNQFEIRESWCTYVIELKYENKDRITGEGLFITAVYMPKRNDFPLLREILSDILLSTTGQHLLIGDFNINILDQSSSLVTEYMDILESFGYAFRNSQVTRPASGSCIDYVIYNFDVSFCCTIQNSISDHNTICLFMSKNFEKRVTRGFEIHLST